MTGPNACRHERTHFDRSLCACGSMHTYCDDCGVPVDGCDYDEPAVTGPEQHAATDIDRLVETLVKYRKGSRQYDAAMYELVALAGRAEEGPCRCDRCRDCVAADGYEEALERAGAAEARAEELQRELDEARGQVRAAADLLASAEKIVPGLITTAGSFAVGDVAEARREADQLRAALEEIARIDSPFGHSHGVFREIARAALAGVQADCDHDWKDMRNEYIESGEWCPKCGAIRPGNVQAEQRDHKGYSEETCVRCGWRMGSPPLNCQNNNTPHVFPSQLAGVQADTCEHDFVFVNDGEYRCDKCGIGSRDGVHAEEQTTWGPDHPSYDEMGQ